MLSGTGLQTPTGITTAGANDSPIASYTYTHDNDGDETVTGISALDDMRAAGVDVLTLGQYMRPTRNHLPIQRFVSPEQFAAYRDLALGKGFLEVVSGPLVRSSYRAERVLNHDNVGL